MKKKYRHSIRLYHLTANPIKRFYWFFTRPNFTGVKSLIQHKDTFLFVRNSYGTKKWTLPGGGVKRNEKLVKAMKRETLEEVGILLKDCIHIGFYKNSLYNREGTVHCYYAKINNPILDIDPQEIEEAKWCRLDNTPKPTGSAVGEVLNLYKKYYGIN